MRNRRHIGNTAIPDDLLRDGITWDGDSQARRDDAAYRKACEDLDRRWMAVREVEEEITAAWYRDACRQLAEVAPSIEKDEHELLIARLDEQRAARQQVEDAVTVKYLEELAAIREKTWRSRAEKQLADATRQINADIRKRDRLNRELLKACRR